MSKKKMLSDINFSNSWPDSLNQKDCKKKMRLNPQKIKCEKINQEKKSITQKNLRKKIN
jgi:hypothetical protein